MFAQMDKGPAAAKRALIERGDFYVEADCCLLCGVPEDIAPEVFQTGENHCFVKRQPCSQDEVDRTIRAMWSSEVDCIRYRGRDEGLLDRLHRAGLSYLADHPMRPDGPAALRDRVSFDISVEPGVRTSASQIASAFRTELRGSGKRVLPALFGRRTVWVSWYQNHFHRVRFIDEGNGRFLARLHSRLALEGLAWLVDDWLRARSAQGVRWEATGDPMSASATPM